MRCPACGAAVALTLEPALPEAEAEAAALSDPLAPVVRRLEAEQYAGPPMPEPPRHDSGQRRWGKP